MRLHRLLGIIMLIDSRGTMKAGNLAKILETSERSIYRDIDILCEAGIPIMSVPGPNGGYSFMDGYKINLGVLENGDAVNLLLSSMGIKPEKNTDTADQLKNAIIKLENSLSNENRKEIIKAKERFFIDSDPWWGRRIENKHVDIIKEAVLNLMKIKIYYKKYEGEVSIRIIRPYGVVVKNSEWYMAAFCEMKNDIRIFKCSRIEKVEVLDESFIMPENFELEKFWERIKQQFVKQSLSKSSHTAYAVKVKLNEENMQLFNGFSIITSIREEGKWIYEMDMLSFETACSVIFPLGDRIEVLEPSELKEYIINKANKILDLYKI